MTFPQKQQAKLKLEKKICITGGEKEEWLPPAGWGTFGAVSLTSV